jgi:hypothetical protein
VGLPRFWKFFHKRADVRIKARVTARRYARAGAVIAGAFVLTSGSLRAEETPEWALTGYVGRITTVNAWHDIFSHPTELEFADAYLATLALSHPLRRYHNDDLGLETEGQVVYNFGDQSHWEFNALLAARWYRFPWNDRLATTLAFGGGLSWASEVPEVEVELEGSSEQLLVYWHLEMTFTQPGSRWATTLRLHHRSGGFGLLADDGGMNALCLGASVRF